MRTTSTDIEQSDSAAPSSQGKKGNEGRNHCILRTPHSAFKWALVLLPLAYLWFRLINNLRLEWTTNPQYGYGLLVPFLCLGLLIRRWLAVKDGEEKQTAETRKQKFADHGLGGGKEKAESRKQKSTVLLFALLAFLYLPTRLIEAATPEWRPIQWLLGIEAVGLTLCAICLGKGRGWLRQLAFPILFFFVAIPWPTPIEAPIIQALTRMSASITIEALGWLGVPAMAHGNVIEVATGMVGIDEACSGIRSFQSSIMISLFLGELYGLNWFRRLLLILFGFVCSMAFNVCRMALLTLIVAKKGGPAISQYHDPAGVTIAIACTVTLWGLALLLRKQKAESRNQKAEDNSEKAESRKQPGEVVEDFTGQGKQFGDAGGPLEYGIDSTGQGPVKYAEDFTGQGRLHGPRKSEVSSPISVFQLFNLSAFGDSSVLSRLALGLIVWLIAVEAGVQLWYRHLESHLKPGPAWSLNFPQDNATLRDLPIPADTRYLLRFDEGKQAAWTEADGTRWLVFYCSWLPGKVAGYLAKRHTPEICLQATGQEMVSGPELTMMNVHGVELPVRSYVFEMAGGPINVFHCRWEAGADESAYVQHESARFNLVRGIWAGRGNKGQKVLEVIITGCEDSGQAKAALVRQLEKLITVSAVGAPNSDSAR